MPFFEIFIPVYNGIEYLNETVNSLLSQTFRDFTVIFVDDGSTDGSVEFLESVCKENFHFRLLQKKHEGSVPFSWKLIIPKLVGKYIQYMSQDDVIEPEYLQKNYKLIVQIQEPDAIVPTVEFWEKPSGNRIDRGWHGLIGVDSLIAGREAYEAALDYSIPGFCCWKLAIIKSIPFICEAFNSDELMQRLWFLQCKTVVFSDAIFRYRNHNPNAITKKFTYRHYSSLLTNMRLFESMKNNGIPKERIGFFGSRYYQGLFALMRVFLSEKNSYSFDQKQQCQLLFKQAFQKFRLYTCFCDRNIKGIIYRTSAISYSMLCFITGVLQRFSKN